MTQRILLLALLLGFSTIVSAQEGTKSVRDTEAPAFKAISLDNTMIDLEQLEGKVVVLNFWATWCMPCRKEFRQLNELAKKYKGQDVVILSICSESREDVMKLLKRKPLNTTVIPSSRNILQLYGIQMLPTNMVVNKEGKITGVVVGYSPNLSEEIGNMIEADLKK